MSETASTGTGAGTPAGDAVPSGAATSTAAGVAASKTASDEKGLCDRVLQVLRSRNAEGDAWLERRRSLRLVVRDGKLEEISRAEVRGLAVRAMREGRLGFSHTSRLDPDGVVLAAQKACDLAAAASPREDLLLAEPSAAGTGDGRDEGEALGLYDASLESRSIDEKQAWITSAEAAARGFDPKIRRSDGTAWNEMLGACWLANTHGLYRHFRKSWLELGVGVIAEDGGDMQVGETGCEAMRFRDLPEPAALGRRAGERAVRLLGGRPVPTGRYPVVFTPDAGFALLISLSNALSAEHLSRGRSWLAGPMKENPEPSIGSPLVTIRDDSLLPFGAASTPFDGEGVDTNNRAVVEKGKIRSVFSDLASSRRMGLTSTGNSQRNGYESLPEIRTHNLWLVPGESSPERLLAPIKNGFWVWNLSGWWIGLDPSNPQFSSAASGLWIENGVPVKPVARITIAGALTDILGGIEEIGNDLVWDHPVKTPSFRVREMAVSGT